MTRSTWTLALIFLLFGAAACAQEGPLWDPHIRFESQRAIDAGRRVRREMLAPGSLATRAR